MTTPWTLPLTVNQFAEPDCEPVHISWQNVDNFSGIKNLDMRSIGTTGNLEHIARSPKPDIKNKTWYLLVRNFAFTNLPETVSGIEMRLTAKRYGRVVDENIQLHTNDAVIGENRAVITTLPTMIYGGETDTWGAGALTATDLRNSSFGVLLRFQSHPHWPHRSPIYLDAVEIRIH